MLVFETADHQDRFSLQVHKFIESFHEPAESFLSIEELEYIAQITSEKRRAEYLQSRYTLKMILAKRLGQPPSQIHFQKVSEGKPVLAMSNPSLDFNLSHSHDYFVIAISEKGQVGVDIEMIRPPHRLEQVATRFFSAAEADLIKQESNPAKQTEIFAKFWSGKEALVKAVGGGVFKHVHEVAIDENTWKIKRLPVEFGSLSQWQLHFYNAVEGYTCSLAFKG